MSHPRPAWMTELAAAVERTPATWFSRFTPPDPYDDEERPMRRSSVLMLFGPGQDGGGEVVLTERAHTMRSHPGQVAFPGGGADPGDEGPADTALREAEEEIGLDRGGVDIVACLPDLWVPASVNAVTPVLAWWRDPGPVGVVDEREVARVVRAPLGEVLDPGSRFTVAHGAHRGPGFSVQGLFVWGFTGGLLSRTLELAGLSREWDAGRVVDLPAGLSRPPDWPA